MPMSGRVLNSFFKEPRFRAKSFVRAQAVSPLLRSQAENHIHLYLKSGFSSRQRSRELAVPEA